MSSTNASRNAAPTTATRRVSRATIAKLKQTIAAKNKELAQLRADVPALVRVVNQLTLENQQLRDMRSSADGNVIPFPGRKPARPLD